MLEKARFKLVVVDLNFPVCPGAQPFSSTTLLRMCVSYESFNTEDNFLSGCRAMISIMLCTFLDLDGLKTYKEIARTNHF